MPDRFSPEADRRFQHDPSYGQPDNWFAVVENAVVLSSARGRGLGISLLHHNVSGVAAYQVKATRQAGHVVILACSHDEANALLEDAGCTAAMDRHR